MAPLPLFKRHHDTTATSNRHGLTAAVIHGTRFVRDRKRKVYRIKKRALPRAQKKKNLKCQPEPDFRFFLGEGRCYIYVLFQCPALSIGTAAVLNRTNGTYVAPLMISEYAYVAKSVGRHPSYPWYSKRCNNTC